jgi:two-component system sensor histidine kinase KdpD
VARRRSAAYGEAIGAVGAATVLAGLGHRVFEPATLILAYLLAVVAVAARHGRGPSVAACVAGVAAFDFFFVPPYLTLTVAEPRWWVTFAVMLVVGLVIGGLTARIRRQAEAAGQRERWTAALYGMTRELAQAGTVDALLAVAARHVSDVFEGDVLILLPDASGRLQPRPADPSFPTSEAELAACRWAFEHDQPAGLGTGPSAAAPASRLYVPLAGVRGALGVIALWPRRASDLRVRGSGGDEPGARPAGGRGAGRAGSGGDGAPAQRAAGLGVPRSEDAAGRHHRSRHDHPRGSVSRTGHPARAAGGDP